MAVKAKKEENTKPEKGEESKNTDAKLSSEVTTKEGSEKTPDINKLKSFDHLLEIVGNTTLVSTLFEELKEVGMIDELEKETIDVLNDNFGCLSLVGVSMVMDTLDKTNKKLFDEADKKALRTVTTKLINAVAEILSDLKEQYSHHIDDLADAALEYMDELNDDEKEVDSEWFKRAMNPTAALTESANTLADLVK